MRFARRQRESAGLGRSSTVLPKRSDPDFTFFALWAQRAGKKPVARVLNCVSSREGGGSDSHHGPSRAFHGLRRRSSRDRILLPTSTFRTRTFPFRFTLRPGIRSSPSMSMTAPSCGDAYLDDHESLRRTPSWCPLPPAFPIRSEAVIRM